MKSSILQRVVEIFLRGNLSILLLLGSLLAGAAALLVTPREEEPQIVVPLADVHVSAPGLSAREVERLIATRLEKLLYQIDGVEYVYSVSRPGVAVVTVRFYVGEDREDSLVKVYNKVHSNADLVPSDVAFWVVKPVEVDDVPILNFTLWSHDPDRADGFALRRIAEEIEIELQKVPGTNRTRIIGGHRREILVELDPQALAGRRTSPLDVAWALGVSNRLGRTAGFDSGDQRLQLDVGNVFRDAQDVRRAVVNVVDGSPVFVADVARVRDGAEEPRAHSWMIHGAGAPGAEGSLLPAVHVAVAKRRGTNAVTVARAVRERMEDAAARLFPDSVSYTVTRDYGETANDKVNELVEALAVAVVIVIGLIAMVLGWREGLVVAVAVPITFSLTLLANYLFGYTINRVTLFALILALGLVVDDPIVDVENIHRHLRRGDEDPVRAILSAVQEVRPPIILATLAVIVSFIPLFFITGMMGPYMQPLALNVPMAMAMSMVVAFTLTPWLSYQVLCVHAGPRRSRLETGPGSAEKVYGAVLSPFLRSRPLAWSLLATVFLLLCAALALAAARFVPLKMLPFDNKNEFQVVIDTPEGTTLERTDAVAREVAQTLRRFPEVESLQVYSGAASAMDFNGLVRQYYMRAAPHFAEVRVQLVSKHEREAQSHALVLRARPALAALARRWDAVIKLVEVPPGPPVVATVAVEIYGDPGVPYSRVRAAANDLAGRLSREPLVVDVDTSNEDPPPRWMFRVDPVKAALSGIATEDVVSILTMAVDGQTAGRLRAPGEVNPLPIRLRLPRDERSAIEQLQALYVKGRPGYAKQRDGRGLRDAPVPLVQLGELGRFDRAAAEPAIYHKNLARVAYVFAETAGRAPADVILDVTADRGKRPSAEARSLDERSHFRPGGGDGWSLPAGTTAVWTGEGEWQVTLDVFRDLGIAFAAACLGIYVLLVYQTGSYTMPLILMISIPLTLIGIMPGFWLLNALTGATVGELPDPVFFTATAMIGMIALAGIAVRNAILLIEFVHERLSEGMALETALLRSGVVRFRPIFLTAGTAMLAAWPITLDPIFSGLAWALIFGLFVSTAFTLLVIPVTYDLIYRRVPGHGLPARLRKGESDG